MCYATGAVAVGSGSYATWYFRDTIFATFSDDENTSPTPNTKNASKNSNIDKSFQDSLKTAQDQQENISNSEEKIETAKEEKQTIQTIVESLSTEGDDIQAELQAITVLVEKSREKITGLRKNKIEQTKQVESALQTYKDQETKLEKISTELAGTIKRSVDDAQAALNTSFDEKSAKTKALDDHLLAISRADTISKQSQIFIDKLTKQKEDKSGKINANLSTKKSKEDEKNTEVSNIKQTISERISTLGIEKTRLDGVVNNLTQEISEAQKKSGDLEKAIQAIDKDKLLSDEQKTQNKKPQQDNKNKQDKIVQQKSSQKQTEEATVRQNQTETRELTSLQSQTPPYTTNTLSTSPIKGNIDSASNKIKDLNNAIASLITANSALESEKNDIVKKIAETTKIRDDANSKKSELDSQTSQITNNKEQSEADYVAKTSALVNAQLQQSNKQKELQAEKSTLHSKKLKYEQEELKQKKLEDEIQAEENNLTELNDAKTAVALKSDTNKQHKKKQEDNMGQKNQEIISQEKNLENQQANKTK